MVRHYELMFVVKPDLDEEALTGVVERFTGIVTERGGLVNNVDRWGKRRLAYEIDDYREGYYVVVDMNCEPAVTNEVTRVMRITDSILRHIIVSKDT